MFSNKKKIFQEFNGPRCFLVKYLKGNIQLEKFLKEKKNILTNKNMKLSY
jgi:hypothetical protein